MTYAIGPPEVRPREVKATALFQAPTKLISGTINGVAEVRANLTVLAVPGRWQVPHFTRISERRF